jgi:methionyl-tRNA formyltransferase
MQMDEGLDTGPVYTRHEITVDENDDTGTLSEKLAKLAANVVECDLRKVVEGKLTPAAQDSLAVTYAPPLRHEDQWVDFTRSSDKIIGIIKGLSPKPGAFAKLRGRRLKLIQARKCDELVEGPPGTVWLSKRSICVATGDGSLELLRIQPEGKGIQNANDFVNGRGIASGDRFE